MVLSSGQKILIGGIVGIALLFSFIVLLFGRDPALPKQNIELTIWGTKDSSEQIQPLFNDFTEYYKKIDAYRNITIRVKYTQIPEDKYETVLLNALAEDRGPDIFFIHNTWLTKHKSKLTPLPQGFMTVDQFQQTFVPVAAHDLIRSDAIYAMPLYVDSLALFYNTNFFQDARTNLPRPQPTWDGLKADSPTLAIINSDKKLTRGGIALGTADTITYAGDIYALLLKQFGGDICDIGCATVTVNKNVGGNKPASDALITYLSFNYPNSPTGSWNDDLVEDTPTLTSDIDAFVSGKVAAIIGYHDMYLAIKERAARAGLQFEIAEIPQIQDPALTESRDTLASYWAPGVSAKSKNTFVAWQLIQYISSRDALTKYHSVTGRPTSRQDLIALHQTEPLTGVFATQAKYASSLNVYDMKQFDADVREILDDVIDGDLPMNGSLQQLEESVKRSLAIRTYLENTAPVTPKSK